MGKNIVEPAKLECSLTGVLAGFALTIAILLLQGFINRGFNQDVNGEVTGASSSGVKQRPIFEEYVEHTASVFILAFFTSIISSLLYAVITGDAIDQKTNTDSNRAELLFIPAAVTFAMSGSLLMSGIMLMARQAKLPNLTLYAPTLVKGTVTIAVLYVVSSVIDASATIQRCTWANIAFTIHPKLVSVSAWCAAIIPLVFVFTFINTKSHEGKKVIVTAPRQAKREYWFVVGTSWIVVILGLSAIPIIHQDANLTGNIWSQFVCSLYLWVFATFILWLAVYLREQLSHNSTNLTLRGEQIEQNGSWQRLVPMQTRKQKLHKKT